MSSMESRGTTQNQKTARIEVRITPEQKDPIQNPLLRISLTTDEKRKNFTQGTSKSPYRLSGKSGGEDFESGPPACYEAGPL